MATTSAIVAKQQPHSNIMAITSANLATRSAREIQYSHNVAQYQPQQYNWCHQSTNKGNNISQYGNIIANNKWQQHQPQNGNNISQIWYHQ